MLMITVETGADSITLRLEGRLAGQEARALARYRMSRAFARHQRVSFDLRGLISVDHEGKKFLARAHRRGDALIGGATTSAIVAEILASSGCDDGFADESGTFHGRDFRNAGALFSP